MFHRERVIAALEAKADRFAGYEQALMELAGLNRAEIEARLADVPWPGARPTVEHDQHPGIVVPFGQTWANHEQARVWARDVLTGVPTVAVDGSQITPSKDISVPVGAVQIGWFVNPHDGDQGYVKDISFEVLAPDELADPDEEVLGFPDWRVNAQRFVQECEKMVEMMQAARDAAVKPVCFFDGSLVVSFAQHMLPERQRLYVGAVMALLAASEECRVPLVGYVDTSYANDLAAMLDALTGRRILAEKSWYILAENEWYISGRLLTTGSLPAEVSSVILGPSAGASGHTFRAFGYPRVGDFRGVRAEGQILR